MIIGSLKVSSMPELDVSDFVKIIPEILPPGDLTSTEAPSRPYALNIQTPEELSPDEMLEETFAPIQDNINRPNLPITSPTHAFVQSPFSNPTPTIRTPLQRLDPKRIRSRAEFIKELSALLPTNDYNLPRYIYRSDLLDHTILLPLTTSSPESPCADAVTNLFGEPTTPTTLTPSEANDILMSSIVPLDYNQGFPALPNGLPFWDKFDHEPANAFTCFANYLSIAGARTLSECAKLTGESAAVLYEWHNLYYWAFRARAYDMYRAAHQARLREARIFKTEDQHYLAAEGLFTSISNRLNSLTEEDWQAIDPDKLVNMLDKVAKLQRLSAGLSSTSGEPTKSAPTGVSVEVEMRNIAQKSHQAQLSDDSFDSALLLSDPDVLNTAQELIIKVGKSS
jgi:hypothetical protein